MKKHIITFLIVSTFAGAFAQNYTQAFDSVFQHVDLSHTSTGILYERVLPFSNLVNYVTNITHPVDTCDYWQFVMAYDELYRAGGQNTFLSDSVEEILNDLPDNGGIVILGMLHTRFNTFDTTAIQQRLYYDADSVLRENPLVNVSLFNEDTAFMATPLVEYATSTSIKFIIGRQFLFDNTGNPITILKIDFGDGYGERTVALNEAVNITYLSEGTKFLRITSSFYNGTTVVSYAKLNIDMSNRSNSGNSSGTSSHPYTEDLTVSGQIPPTYPYSDGGCFHNSSGNMRIYYAHSDMILRKPVLIVDGFDPVNNRRFDTCYEQGQKSLWDKFGDGLDEGDNVGEMLLDLDL